MYKNNLEQLIKLGYFIISGAILSINFDIFRVLRRSFKTSDVITNIQDIIFGITSGILIIASIYLFNNGQIRIYIFIGFLIGIILYMLFISKYFITINVFIINFIKKIFILLTKPFIFLFNFLKKLVIKPFSFIIINIRKIKNKIFIFFSKNKIKKAKNKKDFQKICRKI